MDGDLLDRLEKALRRLERALSGFRVRAQHLIPDLVALGFGREVFENAVAALLVARSDAPRAANGCGRAAFEAVVDLMFLVSQEDYDRWGARARAAELLDRERARELLEEVDLDQEGSVPDSSPFSAEEVASQDADAWERFCEGKGQFLHDALAAVREDRGNRRWHWSGMPRSVLPDHFVVESPDRKITIAMLRSWYNLLSIEAHPAPRIFTDHVDVDSSGTIRLKVTPESAEEHRKLTAVGVGGAYVAVEMAVGILTEMAEKALGS